MAGRSVCSVIKTLHADAQEQGISTRKCSRSIGKAHYARRDGSFKLFADRIRLTCTGPGAHLFAELARSERRRATRRTVDLLLGGQSWAHSPGRSQELL